MIARPLQERDARPGPGPASFTFEHHRRAILSDHSWGGLTSWRGVSAAALDDGRQGRAGSDEVLEETEKAHRMPERDAEREAEHGPDGEREAPHGRASSRAGMVTRVRRRDATIGRAVAGSTRLAIG